MLKDIYENRRMIFKLAKNDFKTRYAGSVFGTVWAFVQPLVTIAVYYFVFGYGLKRRYGYRFRGSLCTVSGIWNCALVLFSGRMDERN